MTRTTRTAAMATVGAMPGGRGWFRALPPRGAIMAVAWAIALAAALAAGRAPPAPAASSAVSQVAQLAMLQR